MARIDPTSRDRPAALSTQSEGRPSSPPRAAPLGASTSSECSPRSRTCLHTQTSTFPLTLVAHQRHDRVTEELTSKSPLRAFRCRLHEIYAGDLDGQQRTVYKLMTRATRVAGIDGRGYAMIFRVERVPFSQTSLLPWSKPAPPSPLQLPRGRNQTRAPPRPHPPHHSLHGGKKDQYMLRGWQHTCAIKPHALFIQIRGFLLFR